MTGGRFAQWLTITMDNRGIKGRTLAQQLGVHDSQISRWRNGQGVPSLDAIMKLATTLEVDPIRLAVTVGLMDGKAVGAKPLPLPDDHARREYVRHQIMQIKGLSSHSVDRLLQAYENDEAEETHGA